MQAGESVPNAPYVSPQEQSYSFPWFLLLRCCRLILTPGCCRAMSQAQGADEHPLQDMVPQLPARSPQDEP